jgi:peptide/nickel transport system substrate-binding protein
MQVTFKLNPQARWDSRSPTNGRPVVAQDVDFSWKQFLGLNASRTNLANSLNPMAPVDSIQSIDQGTVVVKLAFPSVDVFDAMALRFFVVPLEADGGFDLRNTVRGSGPWMLSTYQPSVGFTFAKNPNWFRGDLPYVDRVEVPIITDYAQRLAQFRAGRIYSTDVRNEDIPATRRDVKDLLLYQSDFTDNSLEIRFGLTKPDSPFWDVRVRRAFSMLIDRDLYGDTFSSSSAYRQDGIDVPIRWATICGFNQGLRPQSREFGAASAYYKFDLPEAKRLLTAAGFGNGLTIDAIYRTQTRADFNKYDAILGMLAAGGIKANVKTYDTTLEFTPRVINSHGDFDGIAFHTATAWPLVDSLVRRYASAGGQFPGFDGTGGRDRLKGDPRVDDLCAKIRVETDSTRRSGLINDLTRHFGDTQYVITPEASGPPYALTWPRVKNALVYRAQFADFIPAESDIHLWIDPALAPFS